MASPQRASGLTLWSALGTVYLVWGSTYLAIAFAVESLPPLLSAGIRFLTAGILICLWFVLRGLPLRATFREIAGSATVGLFLLLGGNGLVVLAERTVPSGVTALVVASVPLWIVVLRGIIGERVGRDLIAGVLLGLLGVAILVIPGGLNGTLDPYGLAILLGATISWAIGTFVSPRLRSPRIALLSTAYQMLAGGSALVVVGVLRGEAAHLDPASFSVRSLVALAYLVVFGSIVAFTAYTWLLQHAPVSLVATYAFVNPVVAVILGALFRGEPITPAIVAGAFVIVTAVAFILWRQQANRAASQPQVAAAAD
ncbi:MAG: EamA family transporter [Chloroflexi bacterium]|nr:MAG: EamA family transporter [Chloroflexota bacterium]TMG71005.1 MAG: EamA family transporter [Chloroflexota bacterium]